MYHFKKILQKVQTKLRQIATLQILGRCNRWLFKNKLPLGLTLLAAILLKFTLGRLALVVLQGHAMGTPYCIQYLGRWGRNYQEEIDALLVSLEQALASYLPDSELSTFNEYNCSEFYFKSPLFYPVLAKSKEVYRSTQGAFDPTILPLVNAWERGAIDATPNSQEISELQQYVSFDYVVANEQRAKKLKEGVKLDLNGIVKGYVVDVIANYLKARGIKHMLVELGKERMVYGKRNKRKHWEINSHTSLAPPVDAELHIAINLIDKAIAISSKQRSACNQSKKKYRCFIDPVTGHPAEHMLLAAAVIAHDCVTADAYATAMMARGLVFSRELIERQKEIQAFLVYANEKGELAFYVSAGLRIQQDQLHKQILLQVADE